MGSTVDEKTLSRSESPSDGSINDVESGVAQSQGGWLQRWSQKLDGLAGFETRGIERVPEHMRPGTATTKQYLAATLVWFGINCTANSLNVGILGPSAFKLGFVDAIMYVLLSTHRAEASNSYMVDAAYLVHLWGACAQDTSRHLGPYPGVVHW